MSKWSLTYADYKKVLDNDIESLRGMLAEAKPFDAMIDTYLDPAIVKDDDVIRNLEEDRDRALTNGDVVEYIELNAFLGALKKIKTKKLRQRQR